MAASLYVRIDWPPAAPWAAELPSASQQPQMWMMTSGHTISLLYQKNNFILKTPLLFKTISFLSQTGGFEIIQPLHNTKQQRTGHQGAKLRKAVWPFPGQAYGTGFPLPVSSPPKERCMYPSLVNLARSPPCNHYRMDQIPFAWNTFLSLQSCCCPRYHSCIRAASPDHPTQTNPPTPTLSPMYYPAFFFLIIMTWCICFLVAFLQLEC